MSDQIRAAENRPLRRLLPAHVSRPSLTTAGTPPRPRITPVSAACNACRQHKAKCSGERPSCHRCVRRRIPCQYNTRPGETRLQALNRNHDDLRDRSTIHEEVLELLRTLPDQDAEQVLQRIRSGTDLATVINHVKAGDVLLQMAVSPETRFRYEFPYRSEMPLEYAPDNPYLDSLIYETASLYSPGRGSSSSGQASPQRLDESNHNGHGSIYLKPFHAAHVFEPLLTDVKISWWTSVSRDDVLLRRLLAAFFRCEYQFTAAFQKDLFLEDMAAHRTDFCSALLVNIVLAISCICDEHFANRAEYWNPHTLTYRFVAEAKRIWELEATEAKLTTIQAGVMMSVLHNMCGIDEIGQPYRIHGVALAHQLRIFDCDTPAQSNRIRNGTAFTAWAVFNWETLVAFSFLHAPLLKKPPKWPLPDPAEHTQWYGEIWLQYPLNNTLSPSYLGAVLRARSEFRVIMNEVCNAAYSDGSEVTSDDAKAFLSRLKGWYDGLTDPLTPKTIVLPHHLQLHMYYHHLILTIFEPLANATTPPQSFAQQVVAEAKKLLQTLVRLYYLRHGFEAMDLFIVIPLMLVGYDCIDAINDLTPNSRLETLRSTLILIAQGLYSQRRNHCLAKALFQVIRGRMRQQEVGLLRDSMVLDEAEAEDEQELVQTIRSHWPVSVVKKKEDIDAHILTNLVESYARLNVDGEKGNNTAPGPM